MTHPDVLRELIEQHMTELRDEAEIRRRVRATRRARIVRARREIVR
jgi:hypothetical protein